ncbi:MAG: hypothetical protein M3122_06690 [Actinomycetota bacterium]|nr:hypothetical protein [Actinomycetota bacterium]
MGHRLWIASLGEETLYEVDLPGCCQRSANGSANGSASTAGNFDDSFYCPVCGAEWQASLAVEPEECAFTECASDRERKGAA